MTTLQELLDQQNVLSKQISAIRLAERAQAISAVQTLMSQHGLTAADLSAAPVASSQGTSKLAGKKVASKYCDGATGATWTGRGMKPKWMSEALAAGKTAADFAI